MRHSHHGRTTVALHRRQACSFTSAPIAKALADAKKRGLTIYGILDDSQRIDKYSSATFLANSGIATCQRFGV